MVDVVDLTQDNESGRGSHGAETQAEDDAHELVPLGHFRTEVVGIRYYQGEVNMWEMVLLDRDRHNPYDKNAIQVNNVQGVKVGHISAAQAAVLAPLIDEGQLHIEGLASGPKGKFKLPIVVHCFGAADAAARQRVVRTLFTHGMHLSTLDPMSSQQSPEPSTHSPGGFRAPPLPRDTVSKKEREEALEKMFEALGMASEVQDMLRPAKEIASGLYPHQMVALAWMVRRENCNALPPLWEPRTVCNRSDYINTLTNFSQTERPPPVRGGILADDMGLGEIARLGKAWSAGWLGIGIMVLKRDKCTWLEGLGKKRDAASVMPQPRGLFAQLRC